MEIISIKQSNNFYTLIAAVAALFIFVPAFIFLSQPSVSPRLSPVNTAGKVVNPHEGAELHAGT